MELKIIFGDIEGGGKSIGLDKAWNSKEENYSEMIGRF